MDVQTNMIGTDEVRAGKLAGAIKRYLIVVVRPREGVKISSTVFHIGKRKKYCAVLSGTRQVVTRN